MHLTCIFMEGKLMFKTLKYLFDISPSKREIRMQLKSEFEDELSFEELEQIIRIIKREFKKIEYSSIDKSAYCSFELKIRKYDNSLQLEKGEYEYGTKNSSMFTFTHVTTSKFEKMLVSTVYCSKKVILSYVA